MKSKENKIKNVDSGSTEPKVEVKPVAWVDDLPTKYMAFVTVCRADGTEKTMCGDPMPSNREAMDSLIKELNQRFDDVRAALRVL